MCKNQKHFDMVVIVYLVHVELLWQKLRSMSCTGSRFASCANSVISLRVVALARIQWNLR